MDDFSQVAAHTISAEKLQLTTLVESLHSRNFSVLRKRLQRRFG